MPPSLAAMQNSSELKKLSINLRQRSGSNTAKSKANCTKGFNCKSVCIAKGRTCRNPLDGQFKTYGEWLQHQSNSGAVEGASPSREQRPGAELPAGILRRVNSSGSAHYFFEVGTSKVSVSFQLGEHNGKPSRLVEFDVNDSFGADDDIPDADKSLISRRICTVFRHQMAQDTDMLYQCSAYADSDGEYRALAYTRMGFSRPAGGIAGARQFAVVKDGKIDAEASAKALSDEEAKMERRVRGTRERAERYWQETLATVAADRAERRQQRRAGAR